MSARKDIPPHGTRARYHHRSETCRCDRCRAANREYIAENRAHHRQSWRQLRLY